MLLGNHEYMCVATLEPNSKIGAKQLWHQNGGGATCSDLLFDTAKAHRAKILGFLSGLLDQADITVGERHFHLVHGYPADNWSDRIRNRPEKSEDAPIPGVTVLIGHTPIVYLNGEDG